MIEAVSPDKSMAVKVSSNFDAHLSWNHLYVSTCNALYLSQSSFGVMPSFKACVSVAVPYSSVPHIYSVLRFLVPNIRCERCALGNNVLRTIETA